MKAKRVTTDQLLDLSDQMTRVAAQAQQASQQSVLLAANECVAKLYDAAKVTAISEAMDRRRLAADPCASHPISEDPK